MGFTLVGWPDDDSDPAATFSALQVLFAPLTPLAQIHEYDAGNRRVNPNRDGVGPEDFR
jgi:hypothetical protein